MSRTEYTKIASIKGRYPCDLQSLCQRHDAAIDDVEFRARIHFCDFVNLTYVFRHNRHKLRTHIFEVSKKRFYASKANIPNEQISQFRKSNTRYQHRSCSR